jgi:hypothetical protein
MRRTVVALIAALPLTLGAGVAQAHGSGPWGGGGDGPSTQAVAVAGTVVSVDPATSSFVATTFVPAGDGPGWGHGAPGGGGPTGDRGSTGDDHGDQHGQLPPWGATPATQQVTITTNGSTAFRVNGRDGTISGLAAGDRFVALLPGSRGDSLQTLVANPALSVYAHTPPAQRQLYAFVGTVNSVNTTADTVTVQVSNSIPSGLVAAAGNPATFTLSAHTLVLGGSTANGLSGGSLGNVAAGDVVAGGLIGTVGETLSQVESSPLQVLIDFPPASGATPTAIAAKTAKAKALSQALTLFGYKNHKTHAKQKSTHKPQGRRSHPKKHT